MSFSSSLLTLSGCQWTPHGTYARDLEHFVKLLGFTPHEAVVAATAGVAALLMRAHELGSIRPGYYADCILVDGNPLDDIAVLQQHDRINIIVINGRVHKAARREYVRDFGSLPVAGQHGSKHPVVPNANVDDYPEVEKPMQKQY